ncbi:transposase [Acinetobacter variabilis]|uniref:transposase n=1 Tax=Acinetobacter variabilis TaxID=70346 RepID=UPI000F6641BD|nr:transposase [Acinetobacter variabilis]QXR19622.1 transposase [Acinetobacter variabilis]
MSNKDSRQVCNGCAKTVLKIKKKYKDKKYCSTCYARIFKKRPCPSCGVLARLSKNDSKAKCNECIKKQPCIRCNLTNRPIGKLTQYGVVCNSCSVYFRMIQQCERCNAPSQKLTKISRFKDDLRVCPKCATRDYETCPFCHKYRLLELDENGVKKCKRCKNYKDKPCLICNKLIAAGCGDVCEDCYWYKNLWQKYNQNLSIFESPFLKQQYKKYTSWLMNEVGTHKAALYLNKHTYFFIKSKMLWMESIPTANELLSQLRTHGLRKFELIIRWLDESYDLQILSTSKRECSEQDQTRLLIESLSQLSIAYKVVNSYKKKLDNKMKQGLTSARSVRLAIKPAVALMLLTDQGGELLPDLKSVKEYLVAFPGQAAALHGFINFLNDEYNTNIDYVTIKKVSIRLTQPYQAIL